MLIQRLQPSVCDQGTNAPRQYGGETYGMGVHVENVRRSWDQFAVKELNIASTDYAFKRDTEENLDMLSKLLSSVASKKIPENLNEWFDSVKAWLIRPMIGVPVKWCSKSQAHFTKPE